MKQSEKFAANIGIVSNSEQDILSKSTVALAGCGGDGGMVAEALTRFGIGRIYLADPDIFEIRNINRQYGCTEETIGSNKAAVIAKELNKINKDLEIKIFPEGINDQNINIFLEDVQVVVDEIDIDKTDVSVTLNDHARKKGIFTIMGVSVAFGARALIFDPGGMSFSEFLGGTMGREQFLNKVIQDIPSYSDPQIVEEVLSGQKSAPSISGAVHLVAGIVSIWTILLLLKKTAPVVVPKVVSIDAFDLFSQA